MKRVAIVQSCYIPWKGFFDLIRGVDEFILYDDMQFTRRDWRNRNKIKTAQGLLWLTIPVEVKGKYLQKICETLVSDPDWSRQHWASIQQNYRRAAFFEAYRERFDALYQELADERSLTRINHRFIVAICEMLGITTRISFSMDYALVDGKTERLVGLCRSVGATHYLSGPAARDYIDPALFAGAGINLGYTDYSGYREYPQLYGAFEHGVSVLDLIFNTGPEAAAFLKGLV